MVLKSKRRVTKRRMKRIRQKNKKRNKKNEKNKKKDSMINFFYLYEETAANSEVRPCK